MQGYCVTRINRRALAFLLYVVLYAMWYYTQCGIIRNVVFNKTSENLYLESTVDNGLIVEA